MIETQYEIIKAEQPRPSSRSLIRILGDRNLVISLEAFGPGYFNENVKKMQEQYIHPQTREIITFREPTTSESILVVSYDFENRAKPQIFDLRWLQLGRVVIASEGVYANPPKDAEGDPITDKRILKSFLKSDKKVNGIWLLDNDFGYAPYETFRKELQDAKDFAEGGLARVLEHTSEKSAKKLKEIAAEKNYSMGINVWGFNPVEIPVLMVVGLYSNKLSDNDKLVVGRYWCEDGYAFGVLDSN